MVEKLVEETAANDQHLRQLISICEGKILKTSRKYPGLSAIINKFN